MPLMLLPLSSTAFIWWHTQLTECVCQGEIDIAWFKKYVAYARAKCAPRLDQAAAAALQNYYVSADPSLLSIIKHLDGG